MLLKDIFWFWLPLFASWLLMTAEGPIVSATINRLPDEVVMLAAQGLITSLSVTIESPIINLLATSTALTKNRASYLLLRKFTIHWMLFLTFITILLGFTPLFNIVVEKGMAIPPQVATWVQPGLRIMIFWSAAIAWRRFLQGIMIRHRQTRKVAWGTAVRLTFSAGTAISLAGLFHLPGVIVGSSALMAGVVAEAIYATFAVRPILANQLSADIPSATGQDLSYRQLVAFHLPLASTSLLLLLVQPLVAFSLARLPGPTLSLAAWPVVFQFMLIARAAAFALPEVVIALSDGQRTFRPIRRFTHLLVLGSLLFMLLFTLTPLLNYYLLSVQDTTSAVALVAQAGLLVFIPLPALTVLITWLRGLLINHGATKSVNGGMAVNLVITILVLVIGMWQQWPGITSSAVALNMAAFCELLFLWWRIGDKLGFKFRIYESRRIASTG